MSLLLLYFSLFSFAFSATFSDDNGNHMFLSSQTMTSAGNHSYSYRGKDQYTITSFQFSFKKYTTSPSSSDPEYDCGVNSDQC